VYLFVKIYLSFEVMVFSIVNVAVCQNKNILCIRHLSIQASGIR